MSSSENQGFMNIMNINRKDFCVSPTIQTQQTKSCYLKSNFDDLGPDQSLSRSRPKTADQMSLKHHQTLFFSNFQAQLYVQALSQSLLNLLSQQVMGYLGPKAKLRLPDTFYLLNTLLVFFMLTILSIYLGKILTLVI